MFRTKIQQTFTRPISCSSRKCDYSCSRRGFSIASQAILQHTVDKKAIPLSFTDTGGVCDICGTPMTSNICRECNRLELLAVVPMHQMILEPVTKNEMESLAKTKANRPKSNHFGDFFG